MQEAWIQLQCPGCETEWEANPVDLPGPGETMPCEDCGGRRRASEFAKTTRDFEILEEFHGA